jgi:hypothetical protein
MKAVEITNQEAREYGGTLLLRIGHSFYVGRINGPQFKYKCLSYNSMSEVMKELYHINMSTTTSLTSIISTSRFATEDNWHFYAIKNEYVGRFI